MVKKREGAPWLDWIFCFIIYFIMLVGSVLLASYGIIGSLISIALFATSLYLVWKVFRRSRSVEQTKKALWSLIRLWPAVMVLLAVIYILLPSVAPGLGLGMGFQECYGEEYEHCIGDDCIIRSLSPLCPGLQWFLGVLVMIAMLHFLYLIVVRLIGPLFG